MQRTLKIAGYKEVQQNIYMSPSLVLTNESLGSLLPCARGFCCHIRLEFHKYSQGLPDTPESTFTPLSEVKPQESQHPGGQHGVEDRALDLESEDLLRHSGPPHLFVLDLPISNLKEAPLLTGESPSFQPVLRTQTQISCPRSKGTTHSLRNTWRQTPLSTLAIPSITASHRAKGLPEAESSPRGFCWNPRKTRRRERKSPLPVFPLALLPDFLDAHPYILKTQKVKGAVLEEPFSLQKDQRASQHPSTPE
uniref:Uncharacterized protein LOC110198133 n=1 Tax=Phascolarctos cinereus TaxID=38626 RepID=A0A6P5J0V9_PHACI|nr:uncharacterized protein LOC110198133 [Phascolarctos cinereus]